MIWDDPWCVVAATQPGGTTLPPIRYELPPHLHFALLDRANEEDLKEWTAFVGSRLPLHEVLRRLEDAHIPLLRKDNRIVSTCVLRHIKQDLWMLESLTATHGFATPLLRQVMPYIFERQGGRFSLAYTWELTIWGFIGAWFKGWLSTIVSVRQGFVYKGEKEGKEKGERKKEGEGKEEKEKREGKERKEKKRGGVWTVHTSSKDPEVGEVTYIAGDPRWSLLRYKMLWTCASVAPRGWESTGEIVVLGCLNRRSSQTVEWPTHAEI